MRLQTLRIEGFGKLAERRIVFSPAINVVYGPNEAGKSTLSAALLAALYGFGRGEKELWRPWTGSRFGVALTYELGDGSSFEVQRDFDRDGKGVRVYDAYGNDASAACLVNKSISPGHAHLGIPLEVFVNAAFVAQGDVAFDGAHAERITHALARALDGGPREDAALGALKRLDEALALHVGKKRATVNAPLRHLVDEYDEARALAGDMRERLRSLGELRARRDAEIASAASGDAALRDNERRLRAFRAHVVRARLESLREIRADLSVLSAERAGFHDVEVFPSYLVASLDEGYRDWLALEAQAEAHADEAARNRFTPAAAAELDERRGDGGSIADDEFSTLEADGATALEARNAATIAADGALAARRKLDGGRDPFGAIVVAASLAGVCAVILALVGERPYAAAAGVLMLVLVILAFTRAGRHRGARATVSDKQRAADDASVREIAAAARVATVLERYRVPSLEELGRRRDRYRELTVRRDDAARLAARARATRDASDAAAAAFDDLAERLVPGITNDAATRAATLGAVKAREARKIARDGIDLRLSMIEVRRSDVLGSDDEFALETELSELLAEGVEPGAPAGATQRALEAERAALERRAGDARAAAATLAGELSAAEAQIGDVAALDDRAGELHARIERLERFEASASLARRVLDERTREAHQKFARRLADYASTTFAHVTEGRYADVRVDPTTLGIAVRVPENGAIVAIERLSAGTREQAYLVVRLAMARMFAEGIETAPLLLDDPFAYWDDSRIERGYPILSTAAEGAQLIVFTTNLHFARAAAERGATLIELESEALTTSPRAS